MSNSFIPNSAQIPNILFDYWMAKLTPAEFKVLMAIARKTYGWNKSRDRISLKQITKLTGLHRSGVIKSLDELVERGLILKFKNKDEFDGGDLPNEYEINTECQQGVENNGEGSLPNIPPPGDMVAYPLVDSVDPQNTLYTKPTIQKEIEPSARIYTPPLKKQKSEKTFLREFVKVTPEESEKLKAEIPEQQLNWMLDTLNAYIGAHGDKYKSHYHTLVKGGWVWKAYHEDLKKGKIEKIASAPTSDNAQKNKKICDTAEKALSQRFTSNVFFQAGPNSALLVHGPKDFKKEYLYESLDPSDLKQLILKDLETVFPGARCTLIPEQKNKITNIIGNLKNNMAYKDKNGID
jgi:phage replication O-like protein O